MRDPDRIWKFTKQFSSFWFSYCPDLRFWQVIGVIAQYFTNENFQRDPFYAEEKDWMEAIERATKAYAKEETT